MNTNQTSCFDKLCITTIGSLIWLGALCAGVFALTAQAQNYSIDWSTIDGGGGTSAGGAYFVTGNIAQPDAGSTLSGGQFSVIGGFWGLVSAIQTPGAPTLSITRSGNSVIVSWPLAADGFVLQQNNNPANRAGWSTYGGTVSTNNGVKNITIAQSTGALFFRLLYLTIVFDPPSIVRTAGQGFSVNASVITFPEGGWVKRLAWDLNNDGIGDIIWNRTDTNGDGVTDGSDAEPNNNLTLNWPQMAAFPVLQSVGKHPIRLTVTDSYNNSVSDTVLLAIQ